MYTISANQLFIASRSAIVDPHCVELNTDAGSRCYKQLKVIVDMNDSGLWVDGSRLIKFIIVNKTLHISIYCKPNYDIPDFTHIL